MSSDLHILIRNKDINKDDDVARGVIPFELINKPEEIEITVKLDDVSTEDAKIEGKEKGGELTLRGRLENQ
jgi:hypothetical protein